MRFCKTLSLSIVSLLAFTSVSVNAGTLYISADSFGELDFYQSAIISVEENGETISKLSEVSALYQLSVSEANTYITGQYGRTLDDVFVYDEASTSGEIIGEIPIDSIILINGKNEEFARILFNDQIGYIENQYIQTLNKEEIVEEEEAESKEQQTQKFAKVTATNLNFRTEPTTSSQILTTIPFGTYTTVLSFEGDWIKVQLNGQTGYIKAEYTVIADTIPTASTTATELINFAKQYIGTSYVYGGVDLNTGVDCSGFTYAVFKNFGIALNRTSRDQYSNGTSVSKADLMPGDLVFFNTGGNSAISHVGIYIGNNQYIHSTDSKGQGIIVSDLNTDYALKTYYGARRILN